MRKYIISLIVFCAVTQVVGMQHDPFEMMINNDEKCKSVALYIHHYPEGKNQNEASAIDKFRFLVTKKSERAVLSSCVNKYLRMLRNREGEEWLQAIHQNNLPSEIKKYIFSKALWFRAQKYYAVENACKFIAIDHRLNPYSGGTINRFYIPYFFDEINGNNDYKIYFTDSGDDNALYPLDSSRVTTECWMDVDSSHLLVEDDYVVETMKTQKHCLGRFNFERKTIRQVVSFLGAKEARVDAFKQLFNQRVTKLSAMNDEKGTAFIDELQLFKSLALITARRYESEVNRPWSKLLESFNEIIDF